MQNLHTLLYKTEDVWVLFATSGCVYSHLQENFYVCLVLLGYEELCSHDSVKKTNIKKNCIIT